MADEVGAIWIEAANHWNGREGQSPRFIVLHGTAGGSSAQAIGNYFAKPSTQASTNYVIGQDGTIVCCVHEEDASWANGAITGNSGVAGDGFGNGFHDTWWDNGINPNLVSISIEHCKPSPDNSDQLTDAQMHASFRLIEHICNRHNIPQRKADANGGITGHYAIDPVNRARCPGLYPWSDLWAYLKGSTSMVPNGWKDDGTTLIAQNGIPVRLGFRAYILSHEWDAANVPLAPEYGASPAQLHRPDLGAGTRQLFKAGLLWWTPKMGVVCESQWGLELNAAYHAIHQQTQAQVRDG